MKLLTANFSALGCLAIVVSLCGSSVVYAEGGKLSSPNDPKWKEECGSCHTVYPPRLLTAENWQGLMGGLNKHFGANAALDAKDTKEILDFLQHHAGSGNSHSASSLRISDTPWFAHEHREISSKTWSNPLVKSRSNCSACHVNAERGDWSEHGVHIPGGKMRDDD